MRGVPDSDAVAAMRRERGGQLAVRRKAAGRSWAGAACGLISCLIAGMVDDVFLPLVRPDAQPLSSIAGKG
jgi:hypothetical protein